MPLTSDARIALMNLARAALTAKVAGREPAAGAPSNPELLQLGGCFVSLHQKTDHALRGCIGRLDATLPLWQAVHKTAQDVLADPRFVTNPVTAADIANLEMEITAVSPLHPAATPLDFDPANEGIYLMLAGRAGCFLPQVARQTGWNREQLLQRLCMEKMSFPAEAWRDPTARLFTFSVEIVGPEPL